MRFLLNSKGTRETRGEIRLDSGQEIRHPLGYENCSSALAYQDVSYGDRLRRQTLAKSDRGWQEKSIETKTESQ